MNEIVLVRVVSALAGLGMSLHFFLMAAAGSIKYPKILLGLIGYNAFIGTVLLVSAINGPVSATESSLAAAGMILFSLWIWFNGFHVCDFILKENAHADTNAIKTLRKGAVYLTVALVSIAAISPLMSYVKKLETTTFPVNTDLTVNSAYVLDNDLWIEGTMTKHRDCIYIPPPRGRTEDGKNLKITSFSPVQGVSWKSGTEPQQFGPWKVENGALASEITFYQEFSCHFAWNVINEVGSIKLDELKLDK